jgi:phage shock protein C
MGQFLLNKSEGKIMGVCAGIADYFRWDVTLVRVGFVLAAVCGFGSPILLYLLIGLIARSGY